jgi:hypothetical protein
MEELQKVQISKLCVISVIVILLINNICKSSETIISFKSLKPDNACGPRCLYSLLKVTGQGKTNCNIKCIYEIIGKEAFSPTNLFELREAARKLGFSAEGYKVTLQDLEEIEGYAILPAGTTKGTLNAPLHFILVQKVTPEYVIIINHNSLSTNAIHHSEFMDKDNWNGYALVITAGKNMKPLRGNSLITNEIHVHDETTSEYNEVKNFGTVDAGSTMEHTFTISERDLSSCKPKIISKSCGCISPTFGEDTKGRTTLTMKLSLSTAGWVEGNVAIRLQPEDEVKRYLVKAYAKHSYSISPVIGHIELPMAGEAEYTVKITYYTDVNDVVEFMRMDSSIPDLKIKQVKSERLDMKSYTHYTINILLGFNGGDNIHATKTISGNTKFILNTAEGERTVIMPITIKVGTDKFQLTPKKVFFMVSKSNNSLTNKQVKLDFLSESAPKNINVRSDVSVPYEVTTTQESENSFMICISTLKEKLHNVSLGMHKSELVIIPEGLSEPNPIKLPVSMFVRE